MVTRGTLETHFEVLLFYLGVSRLLLKIHYFSEYKLRSKEKQGGLTHSCIFFIKSNLLITKQTAGFVPNPRITKLEKTWPCLPGDVFLAGERKVNIKNYNVINIIVQSRNQFSANLHSTAKRCICRVLSI